MNMPCKLDFDSLRKEIVGADAPITTPFGERLMVYADYIASGRCLGFVEKYLQSLQRIYANTHTEDDISGRSMTQLVEKAEHAIKRSVNAGPDGRIVCVGTGATGAIDKLQQIVGVALPPATRHNLNELLRDALGPAAVADLADHLDEKQPVVFVGPYEHHSNEISWRESLATVVEVDLAEDGSVDLSHLERLLQDPAYQGRQRIGSFSAASNVTGMRTPVHEIACLLHRFDAIACFDYAASAPYVEIDMNPPEGKHDGDASIDAVFISPHKFLGGPGASGVLVFNQRIYRRDLPPSVSAGGTVDYVGPSGQDFITRIEEREKAGTPGVLQTLKAGMAFELKDRIGVPAIEAREHELVKRTFERWRDNLNIEILGNPDPERRIAIVSFNLRDPRGKYLHPKFVTTLLNDLFGVQSRAGCSCAGPYGHRLLGIDFDHSERYRDWIRKGYSGIKPGWVRISLHYAMDDLDVGYILDAIDFVAAHGHRFMPLYRFDMNTGSWVHKVDCPCLDGFSLDDALECSGYQARALGAGERTHLYSAYLAEADRLASQLDDAFDEDEPGDAELEDLKFFSLPRESRCG
ncbi:MAG: aminotransferase class V-fold PLP-dependent enzyme [Gammaproteobacteria bacterium]|nr:aminotransferase class V-fold PLP-dependent enzyme [Gammaproteobacteria bacterium]NNJ80050.1 aminotransferase class V-fold PLP-dependent enzyme [Xanthomonadales bacterium]